MTSTLRGPVVGRRLLNSSLVSLMINNPILKKKLTNWVDNFKSRLRSAWATLNNDSAIWESVNKNKFLASLSKTRFVCLRELSLQDEAEEDLAPLQTVLEAVVYKVGFFTLGEIQANTNGILGVLSSYNEGLIYAGAIWKFLYDCSKSVNGKSVLQWCHEVASAFTNEIKASRFKNAAQRFFPLLGDECN